MMSAFSDDDHINALVYLVRHSWKHRRHAIESLMQMRSATVVQALLDTLFAMRTDTAYWDVVYHLGEVGFLDALWLFQDVLAMPTTDANYSRQKAAAYFLRRYPAETVANLLHRILHSIVKRPMRDEIFHLLSHYPDDCTIYLLVSLMKQHPDKDVQIAAAGALGDSHSPLAISALLDVLNDEAATATVKDFAMDSIYRLVRKNIEIQQESYFVGTLAVCVTYHRWYYQASGCLRSIKTPESKAALEAINEQMQQRYKPRDIRIFR